MSEFENKKDKRVCKKEICKHGISGKNCLFDCPKLCKKLMKHGNKGENGCNKGRDCDKHHPRKCSTSITKLECFDDKCQFYHVKGTKRRRDKKQMSNN